MSASTDCLPETLSRGDDPLLALRTAHERGWPNPRTLREYVHAGRLPAVRAGKQFMVRESDLIRLMTQIAVIGRPSEARATYEDDLGDLSVLASGTVASWPRFSEARKAELGRLLASG